MNGQGGLDRYYGVDMQGERRNQFDKDIMGYGSYMEYVNIFIVRYNLD